MLQNVRSSADTVRLRRKDGASNQLGSVSIEMRVVQVRPGATGLCEGGLAGAHAAATLVLVALTLSCAPGRATAQAGGRMQLALPEDPSAGLGRAKETSSQQVKSDATALQGQIRGTVVGPNGDVTSGADVVLSRDGVAIGGTTTDGDGRFQFLHVSSGRFTLNAAVSGLTRAGYSGMLAAGESIEVPPLKLGTPRVEADVVVTASQEELAEAEIKVEEQQRLAGFLPNFFVTYDPHAAPLTTRQKFELAWKNSIDPANFIVSAAVAGVEQANNTFASYGQGAAGYGKRLGAAQGDLVVGTFMGGAVLPTLFRQDPRYFYKGTGTVRSRVWYSMSRAIIAKGDNGKWQPAYSGILGDLSAGAIGYLYYPSADRHGAGLTLAEGLLNIAGDAAGNVVQEFLFKRLTPHAPKYPLQQGSE